MKCGKNRMTLSSISKRRISRRCWSTIWNRYSRSFLGAWVPFASSKTKTRINIRNMDLKEVSMYLKSKRLFKLEFVLIQKWSNSMQGKSLTIWKPISSFSKISVCLYWQMRIFIRKMGGHSFLEWRNKVGESVFKVTHVTIPTSLMRISQCVISLRKLPGKSSTEPSKPHVTS